MNEQLYRQEAIDALSFSHLGTTRSGTPNNIGRVSVSLLLLTVFLFVLVGRSEYGRSLPVHGSLDQPNAREIIARQMGDLVDLNIVEGQSVRKGQALGRVVYQEHDTGTQKIQDLQTQQLSELTAEHRLLTETYQQRVKQHEREKTGAARVLRLALQEVRLQQDKVDGLQAQLSRYDNLQIRGYLSRIDWLQFRSRVLAERQQLNRSKREILEVRQRYEAMDENLSEMALAYTSKLSAIALKKAELRQSMIAVSRQHEQLLFAPVDGKVTRVNAKSGETVKPGQPIVHISSGLEVEAGTLIIPSFAAGHVRQGQKLKLEVDAYPADRHGYLPATVVRMSDHTIPGDSGEPAYIATLNIEHQSLTEDQPLNYLPGMKIRTFITVDQKSVFHWVLAPLIRLWE